MLSDRQIKNAMRWRGLKIEGFTADRLQPASYDVRLHPTLLVLRPGKPIDPKEDTVGEWDVHEMSEDGYVLQFGDFVLGSTQEYVTLGTQLMGQLEGKSSLGRLGLEVHSTAGYLDPGFAGQITLELSCVHRRGIVLYPGMPVGQVAFDGCSAVEKPYAGKYVGQVGPTPSRYFQNWNGVTWK